MTMIRNKRSGNIVLGILVSLFLVAGCSTTRYNTADKLVESKQYEAAVREYLKLLSPHKRGDKRYIHYDKEAMTGIGIVYLHMHKYENAVKVFEKVLLKDPGYGKALFHLGLTKEATGSNAEALDVYGRYFDTQPMDPYRHAMLARKDYLIEKWADREIQDRISNQSFIDPDMMDTKQIAVLYFMNLNNNPDWMLLQTGLCDLLISDLSKVKQFNVISREKVDAVLNQMRIMPEELLKDELTDEVAGILGVRILVRGSYMILDNMTMTMDVEFYDSSKNHLSRKENFEGDISNIFQVEKEIVLKLMDYNSIHMDPVERDRILEIPTENIEAFLEYSQGIYQMDVGNIEQAQIHFTNALHLDNRFLMAQDKLIHPEIWDASHNENIFRVQKDINKWVASLPRGQMATYQPPRPLTCTWNRLQWMTQQQDKIFIPSEDSRKAVPEAEFNGINVTPSLLMPPPSPLSTTSE